MKVSIDLSWQLTHFVVKLFNGELDSPIVLALALDELSDVAWAEYESNEDCPIVDYQ